METGQLSARDTSSKGQSKDISNYLCDGLHMISLKQLFNRDTLDSQGALLSQLITERLLYSDDECAIDFSYISTVTPLFFQHFLCPLIIDFGSDVLKTRLKLVNLENCHLEAYQAAAEQVTDYMDYLESQTTTCFGAVSDLTFELLIIARDFSRRDPIEAQVVFGIHGSMTDSFSAMDITTMRRIADAGIICFEPRFSPEFANKMAGLDASEIDVFLNITGGLEDFYAA